MSDPRQDLAEEFESRDQIGRLVAYFSPFLFWGVLSVLCVGIYVLI